MVTLEIEFNECSSCNAFASVGIVLGHEYSKQRLYPAMTSESWDGSCVLCVSVYPMFVL